MGKLTLGDLGLIKRKGDCCHLSSGRLTCEKCYCQKSCDLFSFNSAVDLINKIPVEEVIERAIKHDGISVCEIMIKMNEISMREKGE